MDRSIDFSGHFREIADLDDAFQPDSYFPSSQPLEIEIGSGKGLFLLSQSGLNPNINYLGIEIAKKYARYAAYRLAKFERANARMLRGDAIGFIDKHCSADSVAAIHVYFPDPWWKAKHRKRRVVSEELAKIAERILIPGGELHFWTDVQEYFETGCEAIQNASSLAGPTPEPPLGNGDKTPYRTHFERRMFINDHDVFRCKFEKTANSPTLD
ncbi:MAG: tRNA (guanosine(46)-N7)-methyltransferase TrmB [Pirellulaceae bacterium]